MWLKKNLNVVYLSRFFKKVVWDGSFHNSGISPGARVVGRSGGWRRYQRTAVAGRGERGQLLRKAIKDETTLLGPFWIQRYIAMCLSHGAGMVPGERSSTVSSLLAEPLPTPHWSANPPRTPPIGHARIKPHPAPRFFGGVDLWIQKSVPCQWRWALSGVCVILKPMFDGNTQRELHHHLLGWLNISLLPQPLPPNYRQGPMHSGGRRNWGHKKLAPPQGGGKPQKKSAKISGNKRK